MAQSNYEIRIRITPEGFEVIDGATSDLNRMRAAAGGVDNKFARMNQTLYSVASGVERLGKRMMVLGAAGVAGFTAIAVAGFKYNSMVEQMKTKLSGFIKTQRGIREAFKWAQETVLGTPLMTAEMVKTITTLETYGLSYQKWGGVVADTAAMVKGEDETLAGTMDRLAQALGRLKVGAPGAMGSLRLMGINAREAGLKFDGTGKLIGSTEEALEKLRVYMDTKFGGGMERLGKDWNGLWLALKGQVIRNLGEALAPTFALLKARLSMIVNFLRSDMGKAAMKKWGKVLQETFTEAIKMADEMRRHVFPIIMKLAKWFSELSARGRVWRILFPIIAGAIMVVVGKFVLLIVQIRIYTAALGHATIARNALTAAEVRGGVAMNANTAKYVAAGNAAKGAAGGMTTFAGSLKSVAAAAMKVAPWIALIMFALGSKPGEGILMDESGKKALAEGRAAGEKHKTFEGVAAEYAKTHPESKTGKLYKPSGRRLGWGVQPVDTRTPRKHPLGTNPWGTTPFPQWETEGGGGDVGSDVGGGGGGGGGVGTRARGGTTYYQTIENVHIKAEKIDEKSLLAATRKIVETEMPA